LCANGGVVATHGSARVASHLVTRCAIANATQVSAAQFHTQRTTKRIVGLDDAGLNQHLAHRDVDLGDQRLNFFQLAGNVADKQLVGAGLKNHTAAWCQDTVVLA
jgi:hypothetical protein